MKPSGNPRHPPADWLSPFVTTVRNLAFSTIQRLPEDVPPTKEWGAAPTQSRLLGGRGFGLGSRYRGHFEEIERHVDFRSPRRHGSEADKLRLAAFPSPGSVGRERFAVPTAGEREHVANLGESQPKARRSVRDNTISVTRGASTALAGKFHVGSSRVGHVVEFHVI